MVRCNALLRMIGGWRCPLLPAVGTEPTDGSPTGKEVAVEAAIAFTLTLVLLLTVVDRMRQ